MLTQLNIYGFKSFIEAEIPLNRLTVLTGLNSSGKSSVIQALLMLEKVVNKASSPLLQGHGNFEDLKNSFSSLDDVSLKVYSETGVTAMNWAGEQFVADDLKFPEIIYISADRYGSKVSIPLIVNSNQLGARGENVLHCIEQNENKILSDSLQHENSEGLTLLYNLRAWLGVIAPKVQFDYKIDRFTDSSYTQFNNHRATNVGFGLSYILPVITALLLASLTPNCLVMIENPEAHLHPKGQREMARLIALCVASGTQVIIETHSDHVFDGIRIHAKQNTDFAKLVNIHWFELDENGNTSIESPILDEDGRLNNWPEGLFDQFEINASELI